MTLETLSQKHKSLILIGLTISVLLASLDSTVVSTAMKKIVDDLNGLDSYSWPLTIYMLFSTVATPISGKLADTFGRKLLYLIGVITFLVASGLCGLSQTMLQLIVFRGIQGIGGGILLSNTFAVIGDIFSPVERAKYTGIVFSAFGLASVIGPSLGGYITDNSSWRWIFYINLPIGVILIVLMVYVLPQNRKRASTNERIDLLGSIAFIAGIVPLLLALTWAGKDYEWLSIQIISMLVFSLTALIFFYIIEKGAESPIIPLSLFSDKTFRISSAAAFLSNAAMFGVVLFIPLYVQVVIGSNAADSGLVTTPMMLGFVVSSLISGQIISRVGKLKVFGTIGFVITAIGIFLLTRLNLHSSNSEVSLDMVIAGIGIGINMPVFNLAAQNSFPQNKMGIVTASIQFFRNMGGTIATAILGSVMFSSLKSGLAKVDIHTLKPLKNSVASGIAIKNPQALTNPDTISTIKKHIPHEYLPGFNKVMLQVKDILSSSIHNVFTASLSIAIIAVIVSLYLPNTSLTNPENDSHL